MGKKTVVQNPLKSKVNLDGWNMAQFAKGLEDGMNVFPPDDKDALLQHDGSSAMALVQAQVFKSQFHTTFAMYNVDRADFEKSCGTICRMLRGFLQLDDGAPVAASFLGDERIPQEVR